MTTPEPVSSAPDDTDGLALRVEIAKQLARHDADLWGYDHGFTSYGSDEESDSFVTLLAKLIEQREAGLRSDLADALAEWKTVCTERDNALAEVRRLAGMRARYRQDWLAATAELARVSGDRTIPGDAAEPENAAFLRWCEWPACLRSFDARTGPSDADGKGWIYVRTGMHVLLCPDHANAGHRPQRPDWEPGDTTIRTPCECGKRSGDLTPTNHATCMDWWRAHVLGATPTTGPAPAADVLADRRALQKSAEEVAKNAARRAATGAREIDLDTESTAMAVAGAVMGDLRRGGWLTWPAVPQAPAQPTAHVMLCPVCGTYTAGVSGETCVNDGTFLRPTEPMASCGYHTEAEAQTSIRHELCTPAAREDTTPPTPVVHDITLKTKDGYTSATCSTCGVIAGDFDSQWVQDRVDSHRADNLIPARPAPPVDGARPDCTNDLTGPHPSEPGCEVNGDPYCRECAVDCGPGDEPEDSPSGVSQEGGKP